MPPLSPIVQAILLINVAAFCGTFFFERTLLVLFALWPIGHGFLPWQVVTYGFLHNEFFHLFFNLFGVWMFGSEIERVWGAKRFIQFYMVSVLTAGLAQLGVAALLGGTYLTIGASGGLFGLLLAFAMLFPNRQIMLLIPPIPMKAKVFVAIYGAIELFLGVTGTQQGVAHFAHLGGMLGGFLLIQYWRGRPPFGRG